MYEIAKMMFVFTYFVVGTDSGKATCVKCSATEKPLCSKFDWGNEYIVNCPNSTMCYTKLYTVPFSKEYEIQGVEKGCAPQVQVDLHPDKFGKWQYDINIREVYEEGCVQGENKGRPGIPAKFCYCRSWLCNKSSSLKSISLGTVAMHLAATVLCLMANFPVL